MQSKRLRLRGLVERLEASDNEELAPDTPTPVFADDLVTLLKGRLQRGLQETAGRPLLHKLQGLLVDRFQIELMFHAHVDDVAASPSVAGRRRQGDAMGHGALFEPAFEFVLGQPRKARRACIRRYIRVV